MFVRRDRWIGYPRAQAVLDDMRRLVEYPDATRPPNTLLVADTNNGKTTLVRRLEQLHPAVDDPARAHASRPVVVIDAPPRPTEERLYNHLLDSLGAPYRVNSKVDQKLFKLREVLRAVGMKVLVLDEMNNALAGSLQQQQEVLNAVKELGNRLERPVILTGVFETLVVLRRDDQIQNRFTPVTLPKWELDREFLQLLASFEATLPLRKASGLASEVLAPMLLDMSGGLIGELSNLLKRAAERAVTSGKEKIDRSLLLELGWVPPGERDAATSAAEQGLTYKIDYAARVKAMLAGKGGASDEDGG
ncbi:Transposon, transposition helper protein C, putative (plasmid) [Deinococcus gobiensis I-0]|uniref:Transposon, transposition helper protein C, putative n=2 Tax=Deinococcus TaxID=1298 RepID=H8H2Q6_DEIGI|nr:Transposon, transposition helper protein C, putative [Deinococcus gobiensis I-0]